MLTTRSPHTHIYIYIQYHNKEMTELFVGFFMIFLLSVLHVVITRVLSCELQGGARCHTIDYLLPLVYAKQSFCMGKGEDLNEEFFAVTDERFLTQQKPSLLICWDFVSKPCKLLRCLQVYGHWRVAATSSPTQNH
jgi:hypothetical protein